MSGLRFKVGEIAIVVRSEEHRVPVGTEVEILEVGPFRANLDLDRDGYCCRADADYSVRAPAGIFFSCDPHLRKRRQPGSEIVRSLLKNVPLKRGELA